MKKRHVQYPDYRGPTPPAFVNSEQFTRDLMVMAMNDRPYAQSGRGGYRQYRGPAPNRGWPQFGPGDGFGRGRGRGGRGNGRGGGYRDPQGHNGGSGDSEMDTGKEENKNKTDQESDEQDKGKSEEQKSDDKGTEDKITSENEDDEDSDEDDDEEEDRTKCAVCNINFSKESAYWVHSRSIGHMQKEIQVKNDKKQAKQGKASTATADKSKLELEKSELKSTKPGPEPIDPKANDQPLKFSQKGTPQKSDDKGKQKSQQATPEVSVKGKATTDKAKPAKSTPTQATPTKSEAAQSKSLIKSKVAQSNTPTKSEAAQAKSLTKTKPPTKSGSAEVKTPVKSEAAPPVNNTQATGPGKVSTHEAQGSAKDSSSTRYDVVDMELDDGSKDGEPVVEKEEEEDDDEEEIDWSYCASCDQKFQQEGSYWIHTRGVVHYQKVLDQQRKDAPPEAPKPEEAPSRMKTSVIISDFGMRNVGYYCELCDMSFMTEKSRVSHDDSKIHKRNQDKAAGIDPDAKPQIDLKALNAEDDVTLNDRIRAEIIANSGSNNIHYCKICDISASGIKTLESHLKGQKHRKKLRIKLALVKAKEEEAHLNSDPAEGGQSTQGKKKKRIASIQVDINKCSEPLIGLDYLTEFQVEDTLSDPQYICDLCEVKMDKRQFIPHVTGLRHRMKYCKFHSPRDYEYLFNKMKKGEKSKLGHHCAKVIEEVEGRHKVRLSVEKKPSKSSDNSSGKNMSTNAGGMEWEDVEVQGARDKSSLPGLMKYRNLDRFKQEMPGEEDQEYYDNQQGPPPLMPSDQMWGMSGPRPPRYGGPRPPMYGGQGLRMSGGRGRPRFGGPDYFGRPPPFHDDFRPHPPSNNPFSRRPDLAFHRAGYVGPPDDFNMEPVTPVTDVFDYGHASEGQRENEPLQQGGDEESRYHGVEDHRSYPQQMEGHGPGEHFQQPNRHDGGDSDPRFHRAEDRCPEPQGRADQGQRARFQQPNRRDGGDTKSRFHGDCPTEPQERVDQGRRTRFQEPNRHDGGNTNSRFHGDEDSPTESQQRDGQKQHAHFPLPNKNDRGNDGPGFNRAKDSPTEPQQREGQGQRANSQQPNRQKSGSVDPTGHGVEDYPQSSSSEAQVDSLKPEILQVLSGICEVDNEDDAAVALKVSNALTKALLDFRMKSLTSVDGLSSPVKKTLQSLTSKTQQVAGNQSEHDAEHENISKSTAQTAGPKSILKRKLPPQQTQLAPNVQKSVPGLKQLSQYGEESKEQQKSSRQTHHSKLTESPSDTESPPPPPPPPPPKTQAKQKRVPEYGCTVRPAQQGSKTPNPMLAESPDSAGFQQAAGQFNSGKYPQSAWQQQAPGSQPQYAQIPGAGAPNWQQNNWQQQHYQMKSSNWQHSIQSASATPVVEAYYTQKPSASTDNTQATHTPDTYGSSNVDQVYSQGPYASQIPQQNADGSYAHTGYATSYDQYAATSTAPSTVQSQYYNTDQSPYQAHPPQSQYDQSVAQSSEGYYTEAQTYQQQPTTSYPAATQSGPQAAQYATTQSTQATSEYPGQYVTGQAAQTSQTQPIAGQYPAHPSYYNTMSTATTTTTTAAPGKNVTPLKKASQGQHAATPGQYPAPTVAAVPGQHSQTHSHAYTQAQYAAYMAYQKKYMEMYAAYQQVGTGGHPTQPTSNPQNVPNPPDDNQQNLTAMQSAAPPPPKTAKTGADLPPLPADPPPPLPPPPSSPEPKSKRFKKS